jgi:hypothetical protein
MGRFGFNDQQGNVEILLQLRGANNRKDICGEIAKIIINERAKTNTPTKAEQHIAGRLIDLVNKYRGQVKNRTKQNKSSIKSRG